MKSKKNELEIVAKALLDKEILFKADLEDLIGKRKFDDHSFHLLDTEPNENGSAEHNDVQDEDVIETAEEQSEEESSISDI